MGLRAMLNNVNFEHAKVGKEGRGGMTEAAGRAGEGLAGEACRNFPCNISSIEYTC